MTRFAYQLEQSYICIYHIYSFFFTAKYVQFLLASFLRQKMLRLVLSWRSWTDTASTCFSDSAVRVKNTFARQIGKEWFCWLAEHPCQCAKLNIKSHPFHWFSSFWCLEILTLTIFDQFLTFEGVNGYLLSLHWLLNPDSRQLLPPHSFGQGKDVVFLTHMSFRSGCSNGWSWVLTGRSRHSGNLPKKLPRRHPGDSRRWKTTNDERI